MAVKKTLWLVICTSIFLSVGRSPAAPHNGDVFSLLQPDGSRVDVMVYGDEFYQRVESLDGFTLVRDPETGWICYAKVASDAEEFVSTGIVYPGTPVADWEDSANKENIRKLQRHLRLKRAAVRRKVQARRAELTADGEPHLKSEPGELMAAESLTGPIVGLTIPIQFPDVTGTITPAEIEDFCNLVGYSGYDNNGSVRDYFYDVSNRNLEYTNYVTEYYTALNDKSYYDNCDGGRARELLGEALNWLDDQGYDFSILSRNESNEITALNVFYAGGRDCGWSNGLWPHSGSYTGFTSSSGIKSRKYQITNIGTSLRLGTFCHENGHMICGWPDLYDYGGESRGVGGYCVMATSGGKNPRPPNPYLRDLKGWETIIDVTDDAPGTLRTHQANSFTTYRYSHPTNSREFFLVESRLKTGRHASIPDEGLLIWHIDEDGSNNREQMTPQQHYRVSVEQADGLFHLEKDINGGGGGDLFHAGHNDTFDDYTLPDARWWDGVESGMRVTDISAVSAEMSFVTENVPIEFLVTPGVALEIEGLNGGPFAPSAAGFIVTNLSDSAIQWTADNSAAWLAAPAGGTLAVGESTAADFVLTANAGSLRPDTYNDTITFTDITNAVVLARQVQLVVESRKMSSHWKLDEISGTTVTDSTGHGYTGALSGATFDTGSATGRFGGALNLDGADDTIYVEGFSLPKPFFTISLWFNPDADLSSSTSRFDLLYWGDGNHPHMTFNKKGRGEIGLYVEFYDTPRETNIVTTTQSWQAATWHHVVFTYDAIDFKVYVDGDLENTRHRPGIHIDTADPYIGSKKSNSGFFDGRIDDVRFFDWALASDAVSALHQGGRAENPAPQDWAVDVRPYTALQWLAGADAVSHDVYLGRTADAVQNATTSSCEYKGGHSENHLLGLRLMPDTEYFWRVDEVTSGSDIISGAVWSFVTGGIRPYHSIYEAEEAVLSGPQVKSSRLGYTGTGYADYINASNDFAEWTVFAHYPGEHDLSFRYALSSGNRPLEIQLNGNVVESALSFPSTGGWGNWDYTSDLAITLAQGLNTIRATATGSSGANVDHLKLAETDPPAPAADIIENGTVDLQDYTAFATHWGKEACTDSPRCGGADLDGDCRVTMYDLAFLAEFWLYSN